ncbi:MAG TPA: AraC family transcriptional regulator [Terrimicrobiaceae bacterium]
MKSLESAAERPPGLEVRLDAFACSLARLTESMAELDTTVPGLSIFRREEVTELSSAVYEPSLCMVAQGAKRVILGDDELIYDTRNYLITSVHLPTIVQVVEGSARKPFLALRLKLNLRQVAQMMVGSNLPAPRAQQSNRGMATGEVSAPLLDAMQRLVDLLDNEQDIPILAPIILQEILYRLLVGDQGIRLRQIASAGSQSHQISKAIEWIRGHFIEPLSVEHLAGKLGMSASTFHHHFRSLTSLSPLQFQKQLRLHEARRLMLVDQLDAATAAFEVGYESPSQFSREYRRHFGAPPQRDISSLRHTPSFHQAR